jgi:hypothetical protein
MTVGQPAQQPGLLQVGLKGGLKILLILGIVTLLVGIIVYPALGALHPLNKSSKGRDILIQFKVTEYTKQPVKIVVGHTFRIHPSGGLFFYVVGTDPVVFNLTITELDGKYTFTEYKQLTVPMSLSASSGSGEFDHYEKVELNAELSPATYNIEVEANDDVTCSVTQDFKYTDAQNAVCGIAAVGAGLIILWFYLASKIIETNRVAAIRQRNQAAMAQYQNAYPQSGPQYYQGYPQYSQNIYARDGVQAMAPQPVAPSYGQSYPAYGQPVVQGQSLYGTGQADPSQSNLAYREGGIYTELVCNNCRQIVRNQPVAGVVTCEHCGDKARAF